MLLINPGSHIGESEGQTWTNTHEHALKDAFSWLRNIKKAGIKDVVLLDTKEEINGRWRFIFKHKITGVEAELETHGIADLEAYQKEHIFAPRVYWNGSSCGEPDLDDWLIDGYEKVLRIEPVSGKDN